MLNKLVRSEAKVKLVEGKKYFVIQRQEGFVQCFHVQPDWVASQVVAQQ